MNEFQRHLHLNKIARMGANISGTLLNLERTATAQERQVLETLDTNELRLLCKLIDGGVTRANAFSRIEREHATPKQPVAMSRQQAQKLAAEQDMENARCGIY